MRRVDDPKDTRYGNALAREDARDEASRHDVVPTPRCRTCGKSMAVGGDRWNLRHSVCSDDCFEEWRRGA